MYVSENLAFYLSWVPIRMEDQRIAEYFLENHGPIKSIFQQTDNMGYKNGIRSILVKKQDILDHPIKSYIWIDGVKIAVKHRGQIPTCALCEEPGHIARMCPAKQRKTSQWTRERLSEPETPQFTNPLYGETYQKQPRVGIIESASTPGEVKGMNVTPAEGGEDGPPETDAEIEEKTSTKGVQPERMGGEIASSSGSEEQERKAAGRSNEQQSTK